MTLGTVVLGLQEGIRVVQQVWEGPALPFNLSAAVVCHLVWCKQAVRANSLRKLK